MNDSQFPAVGVDVPTVSAADLKARLDAGERVTLLDTRRPEDFETWHVEHPSVDAVNVPFTEFLDDGEPVAELPDLPDGPLVTCCAKGLSSAFVGALLVRAGREAEGLVDGMEGWAELYESAVVAEDPTVVGFHRPSSGCLAYLVVDGGEAAVVDPLRAFADTYVAAAAERGADLRYAVDTHVHADHVSGVRAVAAATGAETVLPAGAADRGLAFDPDRTLSDGDELQVGDAALSALHAPGHTSELTVLRAGDVLFTADALFVDGVGRPDLEAGADGAAALAGDLYDSIERLVALPGETVVAPGHADGYVDGTETARLADVRSSLALLSLDREAFVERVLTSTPPRPNNYETIVAVNLGRRDVDGATAFELELGPNNCAVDDG